MIQIAAYFSKRKRFTHLNSFIFLTWIVSPNEILIGDYFQYI